MANRPSVLCKLEKGKLIDTQPGFADTFNYVVSSIDNLSGGRNCSVDRSLPDSPVINVDIPENPGGGGGGDTPSGTDLDVVTGISFDWDSSGQLVATITRKSVTVLSVNSPDPADATAELGLWKQNVVASSDYSTSTHEFTNNEVGSVRTAQSGATTPDTVFTATPHSQG